MAAACVAAPLGVQPESLRDGSIAGTDGRKGKISGDVRVVKGLDGQPALLLKGPEARIELPYPGNPQSVAFECWVKLPEKPVFRHIARRRGKNNQWQIYVVPAGNGEYSLYGMTWKQSDGKENFIGRSPVRLTAGRFHHIAMELDGQNYGKLFIDGKEVFSAVPPDALRTGSSPLTLGGGKAGEAGDLVLQDPIAYDSKLPENWQQRVRERLYPWEKKFTPEEVLNFSSPAAWLTAPVELLDTMPESQMWSAKSRFGNRFGCGPGFAPVFGNGRLRLCSRLFFFRFFSFCGGSRRNIADKRFRRRFGGRFGCFLTGADFFYQSFNGVCVRLFRRRQNIWFFGLFRFVFDNVINRLFAVGNGHAARIGRRHFGFFLRTADKRHFFHAAAVVFGSKNKPADDGRHGQTCQRTDKQTARVVYFVLFFFQIKICLLAAKLVQNFVFVHPKIVRKTVQHIFSPVLVRTY